MNWNKVVDKERSAILESSDKHYEILLNQRTELDIVNGYLLHDIKKVGLLNHNKKIILGLGLYNAIGAPKECVFKTIKEIKKIFE